MNPNKSINQEKKVNITELSNVNSTDRTSLMQIHSFRIPAKCMSETRIRALSISPPHTPVKAAILPESSASGRRSGRALKPTEKLLDFIVSKNKYNYNAISLTEENILTNEANNMLKENESQDLSTYSEDEFKSPILPNINTKTNKKVLVLQDSNDEKKSRRKQPPNSIRKITADGSVPKNGKKVVKSFLYKSYYKALYKLFCMKVTNLNANRNTLTIKGKW
ncbi:unnamed protein product [Meganyctiphanes norvegica]|uniref:Uncharacterized protein n=1 Tax=Meganyctiphanes norvegica TaxID=48144 RepID=A0AAV2S3V7_MEGNR